MIAPTYKLRNFGVVQLTSEQFSTDRLVRCQKLKIEVSKATQLVEKELRFGEDHLVAVSSQRDSRQSPCRSQLISSITHCG